MGITLGYVGWRVECSTDGAQVGGMCGAYWLYWGYQQCCAVFLSQIGSDHGVGEDQTGEEW